MSEMVERVVMALVGLHIVGPDGSVVDARYVAREAIAAMRDPTDWMELMGTQAWLCERGMEDRSRACWQAMIDAALGRAGSYRI